MNNGIEMITPTASQETIIYHYCDASALLSILQHQKLWYTHAAYLNDTMEIRKGVDLCQKLLAEMLEAEQDDPVLLAAMSYLTNAERWQYYVCCFSEGGDKLSQWRAYANDGDGFAIGFNIARLQEHVDGPFEAELEKVRYDDMLIKRRFEGLVTNFKASSHRFPEGTSADSRRFSFDSSGTHIGNMLIDESVFQKDNGFHEEEEWRSVRSYKLEDTETERALVDEQDPSEFVRVFQDSVTEMLERRHVRSGRFGLTPYIEVPFEREAIVEVVCGPRTVKDLTESSLEMLKKKFGYQFIISRSSATYR